MARAMICTTVLTFLFPTVAITGDAVEDIGKPKPKPATIAVGSAVYSLAWSKDGGKITEVSSDLDIRQWDVSTKKALWSAKTGGGFLSGVAYSPDGSRIASTSDNHIQLWDAATGKSLQTLTASMTAVNSVVFSPDGKHFAISGGASAPAPAPKQDKLLAGVDKNTTKQIQIWNAATGKSLKTLVTQTGDYVNWVAYSPNGTYLASGGQDKMVRIWDLVTGKVVHILSGHTDQIDSVAYSPDGAHVASGSDDNTIRIWDAATGRCLHTLSGHKQMVNSVAYSKDGAHLASGSSDNTIRIWDAVTGKALKTLKGHKDEVFSVAYSPDGAHLASGSTDSTIRIWSARSVADTTVLV